MNASYACVNFWRDWPITIFYVETCSYKCDSLHVIWDASYFSSCKWRYCVSYKWLITFCQSLLGNHNCCALVKVTPSLWDRACTAVTGVNMSYTLFRHCQCGCFDVMFELKSTFEEIGLMSWHKQVPFDTIIWTETSEIRS